MLAADYPFLDLLWTMIVFFLWVLWLWLLFTVSADVFRRHDLSGWAKAAWLIFMILLPFLGVFIYLITQNIGMTERNLERATSPAVAVRPRTCARPPGSGGAAAEIEKAKQLLDKGAIDPDGGRSCIKQKALA